MEPEEWLDSKLSSPDEPPFEKDAPETEEEEEEDDDEAAKKEKEEFKATAGALTEEELDQHDEAARQRLKERVLYSPYMDPAPGTPEAEAAIKEAIKGE